VFEPNVSQEEVFETCGITDMIRAGLQGFASTVFGLNYFLPSSLPVVCVHLLLSFFSPFFSRFQTAYGQTGSGKTYTMSGLEEKILKSGFKSPTTDGLIPRSLNYLFELVDQMRDQYRFTIRASFLEIYNETVWVCFLCLSFCCVFLSTQPFSFPFSCSLCRIFSIPLTKNSDKQKMAVTATQAVCLFGSAWPLTEASSSRICLLSNAKALRTLWLSLPKGLALFLLFPLLFH
jgi:hypothetical protein